MTESLRTGVVREVIELAAVDSTNTFALDSGRAGLLVIASEQTSGRGRMGRSWFSPKTGNVYMTITLDNADPRLSILTGAVVRECLSDILKDMVPVEIKWPNDILVNGKKICGILCETRKITAIGIGINVNQTTWPPDLEGNVTSLSEILGGPLDTLEVIHRVVAGFNRWYSLFLNEGFVPVREYFLEHGLLKEHRVETEEGFPCAILGLDQYGHLLINVSGRVRELVSGTVVLRKG